MKIGESGRGFELIDFVDRSGQNCSLQQSSVIGDYEDSWDKPGSSAVWFGVNDLRMDLNREQVKELIKFLIFWLNTGSFKTPKDLKWLDRRLK